MSSEKGKIVVVPHTHWDREWYEPHDVFRLRLVHMVDGLLDLLEKYPQYRFTLDGQAAAIDDYLEMRPESLERVQAAVERGQLAIGPFLILLDEFCCDGETIIRNMELGLASSRRIGKEMRVGYLPDMFGHAAQTPQILAQFDIEDAALWRGVPASVHDHAFTWKALNGQEVRCEYLFDGYGNGLDLFALEGQLPQVATDSIARTESWRNGEALLAMVGSDHTSPYPDLVERISVQDTNPGMPEITIDTLEGYINSQRSDRALPVVTGEMRSHARGNLLPGVFSIRTNIKSAMGAAERALAVAERMDALFPNKDHQSFLDEAWYRVVESTAHDSANGCGVDATAEQVLTRLNTASHIARAVTETALTQAAKDVASNDYLVVNTSAYERPCHVELQVGGVAAAPANAQVLEQLPTVLGDEQMKTSELVKILRRIHGRELFGQQINGYKWSDRGLRFDVAEVPVGDFDLATFTAELEQRQESTDPEALWHVETIAAARQKVLIEVPAKGLAPVLASKAVAPVDPVSASSDAISNSVIAAKFNIDGTVDITAPDYHVKSAFALVDEGDRGDSYNFGPMANAAPITQPDSVRITVAEAGPIRGRVHIDRTYRLPATMNQTDPDQRSEETVELEVRTTVELRSGEKILRISTDLVNNVENHRLRILVPTMMGHLETSVSAGQYGVTERGREGEGGWGEFPLPTFPATQFASAGKSTVLLDKLTEYEVITDADGQDFLALTLVRSVGMMSVNIHPLRDEPAGSEIVVPGAQYLGERVQANMALLPSPEGWQEAGAAKEADLFRMDPVAHRGMKPVAQVGATVESRLPEVAVAFQTAGDVPLTSLRAVREDGQITHWEARLVNYDHQVRVTGISTNACWKQVNLAGRELGAECLSESTEIAGSTIASFVTEGK